MSLMTPRTPRQPTKAPAVSIIVGNCPANYTDPEAAVRLLKTVIEGAGYTGEWRARPTAQRTWRTQARFKVLRMPDPGHILVRLRPGDNGTSWDWEVIPPTGCLPLEVLQRLNEWTNYDGINKPGAKLLRSNKSAVSTPKEEPELELSPRGVPPLLVTRPTPVEPPAPESPAKAFTDADADSISAKIDRMKAAVKTYRERQAQIDGAQAHVDELYVQVEAAEQRLAELKRIHEEDRAGTSALATLSALTNLIGG